jgi:DNA-binding LacI/PurR family transcriptional regulator
MTVRLLQLVQRPTAMCIVNDHAASAFVNEVQRAGLRIPRDLSVVSHDDSPVARYSVVPLTTCRIRSKRLRRSRRFDVQSFRWFL